MTNLGVKERGVHLALTLCLDTEGESAFLRLSKSLPALSSDLNLLSLDVGRLGSDLVTVNRLGDEVEICDRSDPERSVLKKVLADLGILSEQINDEDSSERVQQILTRVRDLEVPQVKADLSTEALTSDGGALVAAQFGELIQTPIDEAVFAAEIKISVLKNDDEQRTVFGVVLEPEIVDSQDDVYSHREVEKTAWRFMERYQQFGLMHKKIVQNVLPLESYLAPCDFEINGQRVLKGTWLLRVRVLDDQIWSDVKSGKLTGFSIGGSAVREEDTVRA